MRAQFDSESSGQAVVMRVRRPDGGVLPFGAKVFDEENIMGTSARTAAITATAAINFTYN